ncbi:MAG TPA: sigma-54 dependent transcriptional regulator [Acidobacteriota bacterium]|jgi:two-component system nitrogen regulation response regulator NtrX|nr:sigma-54 dependent transcriptional regulator [Acidobacteriota bacterium]
MKARLLVVDDEPNVRASLQGILSDEGFRVDTVSSGEECLKAIARKPYDVVLLDVWLPGRDGVAILEELQRVAPQVTVVMISGHGSIETAVRATKLGAFDFIEKPLSLEKVLLVLEHALEQRRLEQENLHLQELLRRESVMIGDSVPMQALRQQIAYAAPTDGRVLIYGENGTGKELVARLLHLQSPRRHQPFVEVNCAAIPEDLIEAELFGSVKGAFTGATETRKGKFELADGGTLLLDEVGDMSLKTQAKVLRVLEEQRFSPVGSQEVVEVDARIIAATNQNLDRKIEEGSFREDLYYRLAVIPFEVPPLRDRTEDIPPLVEYFTGLFCRRYGRQSKHFDQDAMECLQRYQWPGNVRELKNLIERLVIMCPRDEIGVTDLPVELLRAEPNSGIPQPVSEWQRARETFEREFLLRKLRENEGNISRTAQAIGVERSHLHRKLRNLHIQAREPK